MTSYDSEKEISTMIDTIYCVDLNEPEERSINLNCTKILDEEKNRQEDIEDDMPSKAKFTLTSWPPGPPLSTALALIIILLLLYGSIWGLMGDPVLPRGPVFALFMLVIFCYLGGQFVRLLKIPSLVGMLVCGFMLRNVPHIDIANDIPNEWASNIRNFALVLILLRAGLEVESSVLKDNPVTCLRLILFPFVVECVTGGVVSHYLLDLPWMWAFLMGFMLAAVSPAVVLPVMLKLQKKGIGVTTGIPTMAIAVAGIDDVLAVTGFEVILGITFSTGSYAWTLARGPVEVLIGVVYGIGIGIIAWYIPNPKESSKNIFRVIILAFGGMFIMFGGQALDLGGAGALGCIFLPFVAAIRWKEQNWEEDNPVSDSLAFVWRIVEPFLFGLVGAEIKIHDLHGDTVGLGLATLFIALALRMVASLAATAGVGLTLKEQIFVMFAGMPKATVQAAIGPVAYRFAQIFHLGSEYEQHGIQILTVAVLSILITAPLGATAISLLAPRLLGPKVCEPTREELERMKQARISIFDPDSNIFTVARL